MPLVTSVPLTRVGAVLLIGAAKAHSAVLGGVHGVAADLPSIAQRWANAVDVTAIPQRLSKRLSTFTSQPPNYSLKHITNEACKSSFQQLAPLAQPSSS